MISRREFMGLGISQPRSREDVQSVVRAARKDRKAISVASGRHATSSAHPHGHHRGISSS